MRLATALGSITLVLAAACSQNASLVESAASNLITQAELDASGSTTVYDAVRKLRGNFLSNRGMTAGDAMPRVYLDGVFYGEVSSLANLLVGQAGSVRLYRAWEAQKFGSNNQGGVIEVISRKGGGTAR